MGVDHLGSGSLAQEIQRLWRELRRVAKATMNNGSIGGAGLRVYDAGTIRFENGGGIVIAGSGYINIDGDLTGVGDLSWSGPWELSGLGTVTGDVTFTGELTVNGPWTLVGNGEITGNVQVTGDIEILAGGLIKVGDMIIDPSGGGSVTFPAGAVVKAGTSGGVQVTQGDYSATVTSTGASIGKSGRSFTVRDLFPPFQFIGLPTISAASSGLAAGSMYVSTLGEPYRVVP